MRLAAALPLPINSNLSNQIDTTSHSGRLRLSLKDDLYVASSTQAPQFGNKAFYTLLVILLAFTGLICTMRNNRRAHDKEAEKTEEYQRIVRSTSPAYSDAATPAGEGSVYLGEEIPPEIREAIVAEKAKENPPEQAITIEPVIQTLRAFQALNTDSSKTAEEKKRWFPIPSGFTLNDEITIARNIYPDFVKPAFQTNKEPISFNIRLKSAPNSKTLEKLDSLVYGVLAACEYQRQVDNTPNPAVPRDIQKMYLLNTYLPNIQGRHVEFTIKKGDAPN